jgi:hypothetical protein
MKLERMKRKTAITETLNRKKMVRNDNIANKKRIPYIIIVSSFQGSTTTDLVKRRNVFKKGVNINALTARIEI